VGVGSKSVIMRVCPNYLLRAAMFMRDIETSVHCSVV
jgi:hypothetical protein